MRHAPGRAVLRASLAAALCACITGCAGLGANAPDGAVRPDSMSPQVASDAVVVGKSSKPDVAAAFGKASEIRFDSGYEVWVYRGREAARGSGARTEFVVLFAPSGIVKKTRIRPPDGVPIR